MIDRVIAVGMVQPALPEDMLGDEQQLHLFKRVFWNRTVLRNNEGCSVLHDRATMQLSRGSSVTASVIELQRY
jgi:hypothetical protein